MAETFSFLDCMKAAQRGESIEHLIPYNRGDTQYAGQGFKMVAGSGTLVTGALTVTTGLNTIKGFHVQLTAQPTGTGTNSNQLLVGVVTTGSIAVTSYSVSSVTGATTVSTGSAATGTFSWMAYGT